MWGGWTLLVVAAGWVTGALAISLPYRMDQAAHVVSEEDVDGFSASRLAGYGVNVVVGGGLDGATSSMPSLEVPGAYLAVDPCAVAAR